MRFYNLLNHRVELDKKSFLNAVNAQKPIGITIEGEIVEGEKDSLPPRPYIFAGRPKSLTGSAVAKATPLSKILGENYDVADEGSKIVISAEKAWEEIVDANMPWHHYIDAGGEGITEFNHKRLDDIIWYSCEFGINYREVAEFLEESMEGTVLCIEIEEPYRFNGCAYINDIERAADAAFDFVRSELKKRIDEGSIDLDDLEEEEEEALRYFGLIG